MATTLRGNPTAAEALRRDDAGEGFETREGELSTLATAAPTVGTGDSEEEPSRPRPRSIRARTVITSEKLQQHARDVDAARHFAHLMRSTPHHGRSGGRLVATSDLMSVKELARFLRRGTLAVLGSQCVTIASCPTTATAGASDVWAENESKNKAAAAESRRVHSARLMASCGAEPPNAGRDAIAPKATTVAAASSVTTTSLPVAAVVPTRCEEEDVAGRVGDVVAGRVGDVVAGRVGDAANSSSSPQSPDVAAVTVEEDLSPSAERNGRSSAPCSWPSPHAPVADGRSYALAANWQTLFSSSVKAPRDSMSAIAAGGGIAQFPVENCCTKRLSPARQARVAAPPVTSLPRERRCRQQCLGVALGAERTPRPSPPFLPSQQAGSNPHPQVKPLNVPLPSTTVTPTVASSRSTSSSASHGNDRQTRPTPDAQPSGGSRHRQAPAKVEESAGGGGRGGASSDEGEKGADENPAVYRVARGAVVGKPTKTAVATAVARVPASVVSSSRRIMEPLIPSRGKHHRSDSLLDSPVDQPLFVDTLTARRDYASFSDGTSRIVQATTTASDDITLIDADQHDNDDGPHEAEDATQDAPPPPPPIVTAYKGQHPWPALASSTVITALRHHRRVA